MSKASFGLKSFPDYLKLSLLLGLFFVLFSLSVYSGAFGRIDLAVINGLQTIFPRSLDTPFSVLSVLGTFEVTSLILVLLLLRDKEFGSRWVILLAGFVVVLGVETVFKRFLSHPRPPEIYYRYDLPIFFPTSQVETRYAYPSGHMSRTAFLITLGWLALLRKPLGRRRLCFWGLLAVGFLMAVSRVYLGEHWLTDVAGGALLGTGIGVFVFHFDVSKVGLKLT